MEECYSAVIRFSCFRIDVRLHRITLREALMHQVRVRLRIRPNSPFGVGILRGMRAQDRTENSPLNPAQVKLRVDGSRHVTADIVTPVSIADVGCCGRKVRLESERLPN